MAAQDRHVQRSFREATNLMIGRSVFPKFEHVIAHIVDQDAQTLALDAQYKRQLTWMATLDQQRIGIELEFQFH